MKQFKLKWLSLIAVCLVTVILILFIGNNSATVPPGTASPARAPVFPTPPARLEVPDTDLIINSRTANGYFYIKKNDSWDCTFLKGVNMGLTLPDTDLNNPDIPYPTYYAWFEAIAAMNANTVKVFTIMNPDFYNALYAYNQANPNKPLYLLQGIWVSENDVYEIGDAYGQDQKLLKAFQRAVKECVDIVHGNSFDTSYGNIERAVYAKDVSPYLAGFILGMEWPPEFISSTNQNNPKLSAYRGAYLYTSDDATPFEAFLCRTGEALIAYETENYSAQTPVAFLNWGTTDLLTHPNEPFPEEDWVTLNTNHILQTDRYKTGMFAAVDIYPYYPEYMNHETDYLKYKDESGKTNPYRAYLKDLKKKYDMPVLVAEFGVSSARGKAHDSAMGYDQGRLTELAQGGYDSAMLYDIAYEGYCGAMLFSWQDEWFKQVWNTVKYAPANPKGRSYNAMSAEQGYGLVGYIPAQCGEVFPDGDVSEWKDTSPVYENALLTLYAKADEGYLHIMGKLKSGTVEKTKLVIPLGLTGDGSTFSGQYNLKFSKPADFLLIIDGKDNTRVLTDAYYDVFNYRYSVEKSVFKRNKEYEKANSGIFNAINQFISNEIVLPVTGKTIPPQSYEAGKLTFGNANYKSAAYNSLADFYYAGDLFEVRLPWALLNVMNPAEKVKIADFYRLGVIGFDHYDQIYIGAGSPGSGLTVAMSSFNYEPWEQSLYIMRYKQSYYSVKEAMAAVMPGY